jgi:hypothetical protein
LAAQRGEDIDVGSPGGCRRRLLLPGDLEGRDGLSEALQSDASATSKRESLAQGKVANHARGQDGAGPCPLAKPCGELDRCAEEVIALGDGLARGDPDP